MIYVSLEELYVMSINVLLPVGKGTMDHFMNCVVSIQFIYISTYIHLQKGGSQPSELKKSKEW